MGPVLRRRWPDSLVTHFGPSRRFPRRLSEDGNNVAAVGVFPGHPEVELQHRDPGRPWNDPFVEMVIRARDDNSWDVAQARSLLRQPATGKQATVVSAEDLVGSPIAGGLTGVRAARRLAATAPEAHVLLVLRNQVQAIESMWRTYVFMGWPGSMNAVIEGSNAWNQWWLAGFDASFWEYDRAVELYQRLFGKSRLHVLSFEELTADRDAWLREMWERLGLSVRPAPNDKTPNRSISGRHAHLLRRLNYLLRSDLNPHGPIARSGILGKWLLRWCRRVSRVGPPRSALSAEQTALIRSRYDASNKRLRDLVPRDWEPFLAAR